MNIKKALLQNTGITAALLLLFLLYRFIAASFFQYVGVIGYIPLMIYVLLYGAGMFFLNLSSRLVNAVFAGVYLAFVLLMGFGLFFSGTQYVFYLFIATFGYLLASVFLPRAAAAKPDEPPTNIT